jgi:hypothetical protein
MPDIGGKMSSEFSCDYCGVCPRNPCHSREEAASCPNQDNPGAYFDFDKDQVAKWLLYNARYASPENERRLSEAAKTVEELL